MSIPANTDAFLDAIHRATPNGEWIAVQHHPNGDWSVHVIMAESRSRALPLDVVRLVIAAREMMSARGERDGELFDELDKAAEAFADRVPWDDQPEPDRPPARPVGNAVPVPTEAVSRLNTYQPCVDPGQALCSRIALDEVLAYFLKLAEARP